MNTFSKKRWVYLSLLLISLFVFFPDENFRDRVHCKIHTTLFRNKGSRPAEPLPDIDASLLLKPQGKIYDCFLFFNELEVLRIRLEELYKYVDHFVIVEAEETHRGIPKPLYFQENLAFFEKYLDKIIYVPIERIPGSRSPKSWVRENFQRNQILRGLKNCQKEDVIFISDLDEIPAGADIPRLVDQLLRAKEKLIFCGHKTFRYFFNRWDRPNSSWSGTAITTYQFLQNHSPQYTRRRKDWKEFPLFASGWHLTTMGGSQKVIEKYQSVVLHRDDNEEILKDLVRIRREASGQFLVKIEEAGLPRFIQENQEYFKEKGFIDISGDISIDQVLVEGNFELSPIQIGNQNFPLEIYKEAEIFSYDPTGWVDPSLFCFLAKYCKARSIKTVVDEGAWLGLSTICLAHLLPESTQVFAFDRWGCQKGQNSDPREARSYEYFLSNIVQAGVASKTIPIKRDTSNWEDLSIYPDIVCVETLRDKNNVYNKILIWAEKLAPKGLICGTYPLDDGKIKKEVEQAARDLHLELVQDGSVWLLHKT